MKNIIELLTENMATDEEPIEDKCRDLETLFKDSTDDQRLAINRAFIILNGFSLSTLIKMSKPD